ncbi:hypothetical protein [Sulfurovum sp.]|uniref:hypothetical protein n=1 Tax=Sulfurovum sp. TaxID=1969726 RepID=UPI002868232D|nr:hypothetical protein [Sulfurovum sp.]
MYKNRSSKIALFTLITLTTMIQRVEAMPMFTTQTGLDCAACHTQSMPKLNSMGRQFMISGMTMSQNIDEMSKYDQDINPSLLLKAKYEKTWDKPTKQGRIQDESGTTNDGKWSFPRVAMLHLGGRITEDVGALMRFSYRSEHDEFSISGKAVYAKELEDGYLGMAVYSASSFGPFSGMEVYNTGLYKPMRSFETRKLVSATQACSVGTGAATGIQVYYDQDSLLSEDDHVFATIGLYAPAQDNLYLNMGSNMLPFARVAYEYPLGDYNLIFGAFAIVGGETTSERDSIRVKRETYGVDFQLEGEIYEKSLSIIATNIFKNTVDYTGMGAGSIEDLESGENDAFSIEGQVMMTEDVGVKLSYLQYNDTYDHENRKWINVQDIDYAITAGIDYSFTAYVPMKLATEYSWVEPGLDRVENYQSFLVTLTLPF